MNDEQILLASAYLDGELTVEQRARAEADPEVMTEVERFRALQATMRSVDPASSAQREAAIGAAMHAFRTAAPVSAAPASERVVPFRPRPAYGRYLGIAAAVVAVGLLGVVIARAGGGGDDSAATSATLEQLPEADTSNRVGAFPEAVESQSDDVAAGGLSTGTTAPAMIASDAGGSTGAPSASGTAPMLAPDAGRSPGRALATADEVGEFGHDLLVLRDSGQLPATPNTKCTTPNILGRAFLLVDGDATEVLVAVDEGAQIASAIDPDSCALITAAPLPG